MTGDTPNSSGAAEDGPAPDASAGEFAPAQLRNAMKAFKKRLKLARLDADSSVGRGPFSSGSTSGIVAIPAPTRYPQAIWDELVRLGKLRRAGHGLYELPNTR